MDDIKLAGKKQNLDPMWKLLNKEVDLGEPTSFMDHVYSGCTQWQCQISKNYGGQLPNHVWIANFRGVSGKTTIPSKSSYFFMILWYSGSCKEMCGAILWVGEQDDTATLQSIYSLHRWQPLQRGRNKICWRIATSMVSNCSKMLIFGTYWTTWYFVVSKLSLHDRLQNGPKPVTNAWIDWFHIFITRVNTNNIVMWVILLHNADWDCFKILTSREILKIQNPLLEEHCAFSEVIHLFHLWTLDWDEMVCLLCNYGV